MLKQAQKHQPLRPKQFHKAKPFLLRIQTCDKTTRFESVVLALFTPGVSYPPHQAGNHPHRSITFNLSIINPVINNQVIVNQQA